MDVVTDMVMYMSTLCSVVANVKARMIVQVINETGTNDMLGVVLDALTIVADLTL